MKRKAIEKTLICILCAAFSLICLSSVFASAASSANKEVNVDNTLVNAYYEADENIINAPAVVCDVNGKSVLDSLKKTGELPADAIVHFNKNAEVEGADGEVLGSFSDIYDQVFKKAIIPIAFVSDKAEADALINYLKNDCSILDMAVMSDDPSLVKSVRSAIPSIRGIIKSDGADIEGLAALANENYAATIIIPQSVATQENVSYVQARFKCVWVQADSYLSEDVYDCINSGAYGVVSDSWQDVYDLQKTYFSSSLTRRSYNSAHRGVPNISNENSLTGIAKAVESGATHIEIDGFVTSDNQIVIIHDDTLDRTTNGTGSVENFTLAQLKKLTLVDYDAQAGDTIPTLDEVCELVKDSDVVIIFELKSPKTKLVDLLKTTIEKYNMQNRFVAISFDTAQIAKMKEVLPQIPTAYLDNSSTLSSFDGVLKTMGEYNTIYDKRYTEASVGFNRYLKDRGIIGWYWTFEDEQTAAQKRNDGDTSAISSAAAEKLGYTGITNNCGEIYAKVIRYIKVATLKAQSLAKGDEIELTLTSYDGTETTAQGEVFYCREDENNFIVVAAYRADGYVLYTQCTVVGKS